MFLIVEAKPGAGHARGLSVRQSDTLKEHRRRLLGVCSKRGLIEVWRGPEILPFNKLLGNVAAAGPLGHILNRKGLNQSLWPNPASTVFYMGYWLRVVFIFLKGSRRTEKRM